MQIKTKLIVALGVLGLFLCAVLYAFMQWSFDRGLISYVDRQEREMLEDAVSALARHYERENSWVSFRRDPRAYSHLMRQALPERRLPPSPREFNERRGGPDRRPPPSRFDDRHRRPPPQELGRRGQRPPLPPLPAPALLDADKSSVVGRHRENHLLTPILVGDAVVGWLSSRRPPYPVDKINLSIGSNLDMAFMLVGLVLLFSILCVGIPLSRHFVLPLRKLARATHALTKGDYTSSVDLNRRDEIGQLAKDFKILTDTLKSNESSRSRWIADISHELRTPLAITLGEVEAMVEDVRPLNKENLLSVKQEIDQLNRLVNDLYELSNAEIGALRYHKTRLDLRDAVVQGVQRFEDLYEQKSLKAKIEMPDRPVWVDADIQRLNQLMNNFMTNEIKYADEGATIRVALSTKKNRARIVIEDSGPGVEENQLQKLFDHLYRVDDSGNKKVSGSGLGLAICKKIIEAHQGSIKASRSTLGGLRMTLDFPLMYNEN